MAEKSIKAPTEKGAGFLFWGLIIVAVLNLSMILGALALFAP